MSVITTPITSPAAKHPPVLPQSEDRHREIQLSGSDLEILIDNSIPSSLPPKRPPSSRAPSRCPPTKPSKRAGVRTRSETPAAKRNETAQSNRRVMLGVTVLLWGAMALTAVALRSPAYQLTPSNPLEAAALQSGQRN